MKKRLGKYKIICDFREAEFCLACSKFTTSEAQVTQMKSRVMLFACSTSVISVKNQSSELVKGFGALSSQMQKAFESVNNNLSRKISQKFETLNVSLQGKSAIPEDYTTTFSTGWMA